MDAKVPENRFKTPRLPLRYSLRAIFVVMLLAALLCAEFGRRLRRAHRQAPAVSFVMAAGGTVGYDFQELTRDARNPARWIIRGESPYPSWLVRRLGIDFFHNVKEIHIEATRRLPGEVVERLWAEIGELQNVEILDTGFVTRPGSLRKLHRHRDLRVLSLRCSDVAPDDFAVLSSLPKLEELILNDSPITDSALHQIGRIRSLRRLELHFAKITDEAMGSLAALENLERLRLSATAISDAGIERLRGHKSLRELDLHFTPITDASLDPIASLPNLTALDVAMTKIGDGGLVHLAGHPTLRELNLGSTSATGAGLARLPDLEDLSIGGTRLNTDLSWVADCRKLRRLSLANFEITERWFDPARLPADLSELCLERTQVSEETLMKLAAVPGMKLIRYRWPEFDPSSPPRFLKSNTACIFEPTQWSSERQGKERYRQ